MFKRITASMVRSLILPRKKDSHKGDYGHVLVIAGSRNMTGAAVLCANGALRSGAGLVTVATAKSVLPLIIKKLRPEAMVLPLKEDGRGMISAKAAGQILDFAAKRKVSVLALGPGLGESAGINKLVKKIISNVTLPVVLDAGGLNAVNSGDIKKATAKIIITPHSGEMSGLTGIPVADINGNRERTTKRFAKDNGVICVLKGHGSIVSDGRQSFVNTTGNPGMAKGGSGDVLTGVIAALVTQVSEPRLFNAAVCGVYLHGLAGDLAAKEKTQTGLLPGDISEAIPGALRRTLRAP